MDNLKFQYSLVRSSRLILFDYCKNLSVADFIKEHANFGRGSIRNLVVHVANVYEFWIGSKVLQRNQEFTAFDAVDEIDQAISLYHQVDSLMETFLSLVSDAPLMQISFERNGVKTTETALTLFTHVITHEFHHKGQILSMSRHMGYVPVDTDIIR